MLNKQSINTIMLLMNTVNHWVVDLLLPISLSHHPQLSLNLEHQITEEMEENHSLSSKFNLLP